VRGFKYALLTSMVIAAGMSFFFFIAHAILVGAIFFLLAFQSFDTWRKSRFLSEQDRDEGLKKRLQEGEKALHDGKKEEARAHFEEIRTRGKKGMLFLLSTQYLAYLDYEAGNSQAAYDLLLPLQDDLSPDALCLLQKAAFDQKNFPLVASLSGICYQTWPSVETALRNASAAAELRQVEPAVGWLQTALKEGLENLDEVLAQGVFDPVRQDAAFKEFLSLTRQKEKDIKDLRD
jgi:hypothetical protein